MVEIRQLRYFVKVAELEHFGDASRQLHVVQPALSRQIKQMEDELQVDLFERLPRGVRLTAAGRVLLEQSQQLLDDLDRALSMTKLAGQGKTGFVRVGFADGATYSGHVAAIIREFRGRSPNVELELVAASSREQADLLMEGAIDVGFVYWLPKRTDTVDSRSINRERIVLAAAESRKLSGRASKHPWVKLSELQNVPFVWFKRESSPMFYDLIVSQCSQAGLTLNIIQEAFTESTMLSLVSADIGVTFITEAARHRKPGNVVLVPVKDLEATISLRAMWRKDNRNPALQEFVKSII